MKDELLGLLATLLLVVLAVLGGLLALSFVAALLYAAAISLLVLVGLSFANWVIEEVLP
ncbi:hypothetical protein [Aeromonas hydrophila]|uniref:hypothetical protein n=1 Tax=Aeromonas hydrophila TaxID=644 RepID=UPI003D1E97E3